MRLFLVILFCFSYLQADENDKNKILNEKTFSGPMGMGLSKSYEMGKKKICFFFWEGPPRFSFSRGKLFAQQRSIYAIHLCIPVEWAKIRPFQK